MASSGVSTISQGAPPWLVDTELPAAAALADGAANPTTPVVGALQELWSGSVWNRQLAAAGIGDANAGGAAPAVAGLGWNGASWDRLRSTLIFKTASASAAGSTALWTPAAGKKFRLLRVLIVLEGNAATAAGGSNLVQLLDSAAGMPVALDLFMPAAAGAVLGGWTPGWIDLGNGILSAAANNVLNVNLQTAITGVSGLRVIACGTEE